MRFYEVLVASGQYHGGDSLVYSYDDSLQPLSVVTVPLRQRFVTGFVVKQTKKPSFATKSVKTVLSQQPLPSHCLELAKWLAQYYNCSLSEALRQFAPSRPSLRASKSSADMAVPPGQLRFDHPLNAEQTKALKAIKSCSSTTVMLHGDTGSGKTRVYLELAKEVLRKGESVILLTPEISLTSQLISAASHFLDAPVLALHSRLTEAQRKKIWLKILEADTPVVVIGPRSALFSPVRSPGLIILDEAHEPAYKQDQTPRYHAVRVASQLGNLTGARVVLGSATPAIADYFVAEQKNAVVRMRRPANLGECRVSVVDLTDRQNFSRHPYLSNQLIDAIRTTLNAKKQIIIYLNRRGSARLILCQNCGWQMACPNCDIPLVYHADDHQARCHICGWHDKPPVACPVCYKPEISYKSIGTKALIDEVSRFFPEAKIKRFDSDSKAGEQLNELYDEVLKGNYHILVGTQLLAKGLDLPKLGLVGVIAAETSLSLPDYTSEERAFQLLYQVIGRVGRGHGSGQVIIQSYSPDSLLIKAAADRDWLKFYKSSVVERRDYRFPPFSYLMQLTIKRVSADSASKSADKLKDQLVKSGVAVEVVGPTPSFYARRGRYYYYQLVVKSKDRGYLQRLAKDIPPDWQVNIDPVDLL